MNHQLVSEATGGVANDSAFNVPIKVLIVDWNITSGDSLESPVAVRHISPKDFERNLTEQCSPNPDGLEPLTTDAQVTIS